jgi:hypothetical protein
MQSSKPIHRLLMALLLSVALNIFLCAIDFQIGPHQKELSQIQRCVVAMLMPAATLVTWVAPGHSGAQIFYGVVFSILVYTIAIWMTLTAIAWGRRRA